MRPQAKKIDEIDAKILEALLKEARTTFTDMSKECDISVGAVRARFKRLQREGVINGAIMQVNPHSLGYKCVCDMIIKTDPGKEKELMEFMTKKPYPKVIFGPRGRYTMDIVSALPTIKDLREVMEELEASPYIKHVESLIWVEATTMDHAENLVIHAAKNTNKKDDIHKTIQIRQIETIIDDTDKKIIEILSHAARTPFRRIAKRLNISTKNVIQRYKRLRGNVLGLSTITVNLQKLGYNAMAYLFIKVENKSETSRIFSELLQIPNLIVAIRFIGNYDIKAIVVLADFEDMFELSDRIEKIKGIEEMDIFLNRAAPKWPLNIFASILTDSKTVVRHRKFEDTKNRKNQTKQKEKMIQVQK